MDNYGIQILPCDNLNFYICVYSYSREFVFATYIDIRRLRSSIKTAGGLHCHPYGPDQNWQYLVDGNIVLRKNEGRVQFYLFNEEDLYKHIVFSLKYSSAIDDMMLHIIHLCRLFSKKADRDAHFYNYEPTELAFQMCPEVQSMQFRYPRSFDDETEGDYDDDSDDELFHMDTDGEESDNEDEFL